MQPFATDLDIKNRALQHLGARRIASDTEDSKNASAVNFCYDKLRVAELRRNVWRTATRRVVLRPIETSLFPEAGLITSPTVAQISPTMQFVPGAYSPANVYILGSIVSFNGLLYIAEAFATVGASPDKGDPWTQYFGVMTVSPYDTSGSTSYYAGEIVYTPVGASPGVYLSLQNLNSDVPTTIPAWNATTPYQMNATVTYSSSTWQSVIDLNLNNTPGASSTVWAAVPSNQVDQMFGPNWLKLGAATVQSLTFIYPLGSGPVSQSATKNVYMLPFGFLRRAPDDPKAGSQSYLGAPSGRVYDDWEFEGNFMVSGYSMPVALRFVADVNDVSEMDPMFCEGLACRIATEICEELTQSDAKLGAIAAQYKEFMTEARVVNGIETGAQEPPLDDYIQARL